MSLVSLESSPKYTNGVVSPLKCVPRTSTGESLVTLGKSKSPERRNVRRNIDAPSLATVESTVVEKNSASPKKINFAAVAVTAGNRTRKLNTERNELNKYKKMLTKVGSEVKVAASESIA